MRCGLVHYKPELFCTPLDATTLDKSAALRQKYLVRVWGSGSHSGCRGSALYSETSCAVGLSQAYCRYLFVFCFAVLDQNHCFFMLRPCAYNREQHLTRVLSISGHVSVFLCTFGMSQTSSVLISFGVDGTWAQG